MTNGASLPAFTVTVEQNPHLALGARTIQAVVRVETTGSSGAREVVEPPSAAEVVIIDTSGSMHGVRIGEARRAAGAAVEALREGTEFAVVAGHSVAEAVYPRTGALARASQRTRQEALRALEGIQASGSTSMSTWLMLADELLAGSTAAIKHALLLTDGLNNEGERPLKAALAACAGRFDCDCRGIGASWDHREVDTITHALNGRWKPVASPHELAEDFRSVIETSMTKRVAGVELHVSLTGNARVVSFGQVMPTIESLTDRRSVLDDGVTAFPLGAWGEEVREYLLEIEVDQTTLRIENEGRAGAAMLHVAGPGGYLETKPRWVFAVWTADMRRSAPIDPKVAGYLGQQDLQRAVREALDLLDRTEDDDAARDGFGRAIALAHKFERHDLIECLSRIVIIVDPVVGDVRVRPRHEIERVHRIWSDHLSSQATPISSAWAEREAVEDE